MKERAEKRPRAIKANVRKAGMDLWLWVLMHSPDAILHAAVGPVLFSPLLKLVTENDISMSSDEVPVNVRHERNVIVVEALPALTSIDSIATIGRISVHCRR
ncbi:hypothetical protein H257_17011 [Aphanomyces astaci]|uniref:Uncharacterized protein n=1 Tax=Aphanomyces astaci TaxID=112090 RepID=W4FGN0_APHAT|nr:hypothetical protein H257_17011 [Aphanomyces astaci]ETV66580.1 hypothetical protein H257_17011 [Aphanomyces astaci]|eukprot:XP_009843951.1 hypothetical protein H257_17011 [Aphanomyces astaci]